MTFDFSFGKRFGEEHLTPEQREIVDLLERGEISEQEARDRLGPDVRLFAFQLGGDDEEAPPSGPAHAETDEEALARELVERISREVDAETSGPSEARHDARARSEVRQAVVEGLMLGEVAPQEAARRLGQNSDLPLRVGDTAEHGSGGLTQADDAAARLVADVVREVDAEGSEPRQRGLPDVNFGLLGLAGVGLLLVGALGGDDSRAHVLTSALVAAGAFVFFLALGVPVGLLARRRPLAPPAAIWGALAMLAWGLLLAVTGSWHAYMPTVLFVGFVVALAVAGAGAIGIARRAEETMDLTRARANADESQKTGG